MAKKILLADDSVPAQNIGKRILTEAGYEVTTAGNGLEAMRKLHEAPPDLAILDIFMPGYSGLEMCARLRKNAETAELPVILTVGRLEPYRDEEGEQAKANAVVVKPFASAELLRSVRTLLHEIPQEAVPAVIASAVKPPAEEVAPPETTVEPEAPVYGVVEESPAAAESAEIELNSTPGLRFDPDASPTPFCASATEFLNLPPEPTFGEAHETDAIAPQASAVEPTTYVAIPEREPLLETAGQTEEAGDTAEARHQAFEKLFNSSELPPLEDKTQLLPSLATYPASQEFTVSPDPELEIDAPPIASEPEIFQQEILDKPVPELNAVGDIPAHDHRLLDDSGAEPAPWSAELQTSSETSANPTLGEEAPLDAAMQLVDAPPADFSAPLANEEAAADMPPHSETELVQRAVDRVFDRLKQHLVTEIMHELAKEK